VCLRVDFQRRFFFGEQVDDWRAKQGQLLLADLVFQCSHIAIEQNRHVERVSAIKIIDVRGTGYLQIE